MGEIKSRKHIWIILTCCGLTASSIGLCVNAYGVFYTPLSNAFGVGRAAVTYHATISGLITGFGAPIVAKLMKKIPVKNIVLAGASLSSLSFLMMAFADELWVLNLCGVIRGIGNCCFYMPVVTQIIGNWFKRKQGTVMGFVMAFSGIAGALLSPGLTAIINKYGYRVAAFLGAIFIAVLVLPNTFMFLNLTPEEAQISACGNGNNAIKNNPDKKRIVRKVNLFTVKSPVFWCLTGMTFLSVFITGMTSHLSGYAESIGLGSIIGATMISFVMFGNIASKFISGIMSDKIGTVSTFSIMYLLAISGILLLQLNTSKRILLIASLLFGCIYACSAVGIPSIVRQIYGNLQYGDAYAVISMVSTIAPSIAMVVIGTIYDSTQNYYFVLLTCTIFGCLALVCWNVAFVLSKRNNDFDDV